VDLVSGDRHVRAFKAADAFAVEAYRASAGLHSSAPVGLIEAIRRVAMRSGGALVEASANPPGGADERRLLERARAALIEGRYYLYLARRLGMLDVKRYRGLTARQEAALRELDALLHRETPAAARQPP
jgi:four helix bundle protein